MGWCAISSSTSNGAVSHDAPLVIMFQIFFNFFYFFKKLKRRSTGVGGAFGGSGGQVTNGAPWDGAPLLVELVMAHHPTVRH